MFIQELPRDKNKEDFVWTELTHATKRKYQRFVQKMQLLKEQKREKRAAEQ